MVDTNVLVAGITGFRKPLAAAPNPSSRILRSWANESRFVWLVTEEIRDEYKEILKRLRVRPGLIGKTINLIRERTEMVKVRKPAEISPDPKDDPFCHCAESGAADFVITLNPADFPQRLLNAKVVTPAAFRG